jgi:hypothetical protein
MRGSFFLTSILALSLVSGILPKAYGSVNKPKILPFKVWKQKKIDEAKTIVLELKHESKKLSQVKSDDQDDEKEEIVQKLSQANLNLGVARELSANDYFLLYVAPQFKGSNEALIEAAKTLSAKDMADILLAYQKRIQSGDAYNGADSPPTTDEPPSQEKTALAP